VVSRYTLGGTELSRLLQGGKMKEGERMRRKTSVGRTKFPKNQLRHGWLRGRTNWYRKGGGGG